MLPILLGNEWLGGFRVSKGAAVSLQASSFEIEMAGGFGVGALPSCSPVGVILVTDSTTAGSWENEQELPFRQPCWAKNTQGFLPACEPAGRKGSWVFCRAIVAFQDLFRSAEQRRTVSEERVLRECGVCQVQDLLGSCREAYQVSCPS